MLRALSLLPLFKRSAYTTRTSFSKLSSSMLCSRAFLFLMAGTYSLLSPRAAPPNAHVNAFLFAPPAPLMFGARRTRQGKSTLYQTDESFLDVEFEKVEQNEESLQATATATTSETSSLKSPLQKSLLELSLDMDPQWKEARIPFCFQDQYIDCNLAFTVDLDGTTYGIGVPCDAAVAIVLEEKNGKVTYINPALSEHSELVEIMATQLQQLLGNDVYLRNTPKILTISGNLDKYTADWQTTLFNDTVSTEDLLDDSDEGLDFFYDFMKSELGEEEFQKTLDEGASTSIDKEMLNLFNVPGLGDQQNDLEGIENMIKELINEELSEQESFTKLGEDLDHEGVALKLIGFNFRNTNKSYSLVKLLKPFTIVGKYNENGEKGDLSFELLTPEEENLVIPRLEQICQTDLEQAGLSLQA